MVKTYTQFSGYSMYVTNSEGKIIGNFRGVQFNPKKFEGKVIFKSLDVEELPEDYNLKLMNVDSKGKSNVIILSEISLDKDYEEDKIIDFTYNESNDNLKDAVTPKED